MTPNLYSHPDNKYVFKQLICTHNIFSTLRQRFVFKPVEVQIYIYIENVEL